MQELFNEVFGVGISEGGLHCLLNKLAKKALPLYQFIKDSIRTSPVAGADETGAKVNGKKHWIWTWQTPQLTYIAASQNRGYQTIESEFESGLPQTILVHDCWKAHFKTPATATKYAWHTC